MIEDIRNICDVYFQSFINDLMRIFYELRSCEYESENQRSSPLIEMLEKIRTIIPYILKIEDMVFRTQDKEFELADLLKESLTKYINVYKKKIEGIYDVNINDDIYIEFNDKYIEDLQVICDRMKQTEYIYHYLYSMNMFLKFADIIELLLNYVFNELVDIREKQIKDKENNKINSIDDYIEHYSIKCLL